MQLMMKLGYSFSRQFSAKFVVNNVEIYSDYNVPSDPTISSFTERFFYLIYYWRFFFYIRPYFAPKRRALHWAQLLLQAAAAVRAAPLY